MCKPSFLSLLKALILFINHPPQGANPHRAGRAVSILVYRAVSAHSVDSGRVCAMDGARSLLSSPPGSGAALLWSSLQFSDRRPAQRAWGTIMAHHWAGWDLNWGSPKPHHCAVLPDQPSCQDCFGCTVPFLTSSSLSSGGRKIQLIILLYSSLAWQVLLSWSAHVMGREETESVAEPGYLRSRVCQLSGHNEEPPNGWIKQ